MLLFLGCKTSAPQRLHLQSITNLLIGPLNRLRILPGNLVRANLRPLGIPRLRPLNLLLRLHLRAIALRVGSGLRAALLGV